jgi:Ras-related protein Rab-1A
MADDADYNHLFKVLVLGDKDVGKTQLLLRFTDDIWANTHVSTVGVDFKLQFVDVGGKRCKLQIWDTANQGLFSTVTSSMYRGAHGIVLVYNRFSRKTFESLDEWMLEIQKFAGGGVVKVLAGHDFYLDDDGENSDAGRPADFEVSEQDAAELAASYGCDHFCVSAETSHNVEAMFEQLVRHMIQAAEDNDADNVAANIANRAEIVELTATNKHVSAHKDDSCCN